MTWLGIKPSLTISKLTLNHKKWCRSCLYLFTKQIKFIFPLKSFKTSSNCTIANDAAVALESNLKGLRLNSRLSILDKLWAYRWRLKFCLTANFKSHTCPFRFSLGAEIFRKDNELLFRSGPFCKKGHESNLRSNFHISSQVCT